MDRSEVMALIQAERSRQDTLIRQLQGPDGSVLAWPIKFTSAVGTAPDVQIERAGVGTMRVVGVASNDAWLGIGGSPSVPLHVTNSVSSQELLRLTAQAGQPWMSFHQGGSRRAFIQGDSNALYLRSDVGHTSVSDKLTLGDIGRAYLRLGSGSTTAYIDLVGTHATATGLRVFQSTGASLGYLFGQNGEFGLLNGNGGWNVRSRSADANSYIAFTTGNAAGVATTTPSRNWSVNGSLGYVTLHADSDVRQKKNVARLPADGLVERFMKLKPIAFEWRESVAPDRVDTELVPQEIGFGAQEVLPLFPELVDRPGGPLTTAPEFYGLDYTKFGVLAVAMGQRHEREIGLLRGSVDALYGQVAPALAGALERLDERLRALEDV